MTPRIAGVDEAGRGPLAGPVVAAAVILRPGTSIAGVADSKTLAPAERVRLAGEIRRRALCYGVGWADPSEIDAIDILQATFLAMRRAVLGLRVRPDRLRVDGNRLPSLAGLGEALSAEAIVRGDASDPAISAASISGENRARRLYGAHGSALSTLWVRDSQGIPDRPASAAVD